MQNLDSLLQQRSRPFGVTIIAILAAVQGVLTLVLSLFLLVPAFSSTLPRGLLVSVFFFFLILGVIELVLAWGLWTLRPWAFWATVILEIIGLANAILGLFNSNNSRGLASDILNIVVPIVILVYFLVDRDVRAAFRT